MAIKPIEILINAKDQASGVFAKLDGKLKAMGVAIAGYFGVKAFAGIVNSAADFEEAMSKVQAATGASADELAQLKQTAEDAGASTKFTAVEAAGALETLAKSGLSATDSIKALPAVLDLAQAGGIDLAQASEYMTKAVMGLGLSFDDAGRVADVLAKGANASNTSVTGLAQALSYAAPVANSLGMSLEGTVAIIGKFADAGIDASRAGTALNSIMSQFLDPASKFREELANAGITTGDFEKALHQLAAAGPAGSKAINAVGQEAGPALRALLNQGIGALDDLKGKLSDAGGSAKETAAVMGNNLNGAIEGLSSAWEAVTTVLGTPVLPVLKAAVDDLADAFRSAVADGTIQKFGDAIAAGFQAGIEWAREFLATINFEQVAADMRAFADRASEVFDQIGQYASNAGNIVQAAYGVMSAGTNVVLTAVYGIGAAFAGVASNIQSGIAGLYDLLAKVTFGSVSDAYKQAADSIRLSAEATWAASEELEKKASAAFLAVERGAVLARDGFDGLASGATGSAVAVAAAKPVVDATASSVEALAESMRKEAEAAYVAVEAEEKKADANKQAAQAAEENRTAIATLRAEYAALIASGNLQGAVEKLTELNAALRNTGTAAKDGAAAAKDAAAAIAAAYKDLGITTDASLKEVADRAKVSFDVLAQSGKASARELGQGFADAAQKAIDANNGIAPSWVKAQAAAQGYAVQVDAAGKTTVVAMGAAQGSVNAVAGAHQGAVGAVAAHGSAVANLGAAYSDAGAKALAAAGHFAAANLAQKNANTSANSITNNQKSSVVGKMEGEVPILGTTEEMAVWKADWDKEYYKDNRPGKAQFGMVGFHGMYKAYVDGQYKAAMVEVRRKEAVKSATERSTARKAEAGDVPTTAPATAPATSSGSSSGAAAQYISNVNIQGVGSAQVKFADADSQRATEDLLRKLAQAKGVAQ